MGSSQQFSLRWNDYLRHITRAFDNLRADENFVDVTLSCEGKKIHAHKMLLSACSSYFRDLFKENPCQHPIIILKNVKFDDLKALVDFMYQGEVNVEQDQLTSFLTTAELLAVQGLTDGTPKEVNESLEEVTLEYPSTSKTKSPMFIETCLNSQTNKIQLRKKRSAVSEEDDSRPKIKSTKRDQHDVEYVPITMSNLKEELPEYVDNADESLDHDNEIDHEDDSCDFDDQKQDNAEANMSGYTDGNDGDQLSTAEMSQILGHPGTSDDMQQDSSLQDMTSSGTPNYCESDNSYEDLAKKFSPKKKRYSCALCGKSFCHRGSLDHHKVTHTENTKCHICHKVFSRRYTLKKHMARKHLCDT